MDFDSEVSVSTAYISGAVRGGPHTVDVSDDFSENGPQPVAVAMRNSLGLIQTNVRQKHNLDILRCQLTKSMLSFIGRQCRDRKDFCRSHRLCYCS